MRAWTPCGMDACGNGRLVGWQGVHLVWGGLGGDRVRGVSVESALPGRNAEHTILAVFCERFGAVARTGSVLYIPLEWWRTVKPYSMNENKHATHGTA